MLRILALILLMLPGVVHAKDSLRAQRVEAAWLDWLSAQDVTRGTLALLHNGKPVLVTAIGQDARKAVPLASLGKSITGACVAKLVARKTLRYDTKLSDILGREAHQSDLTIAELLTHTSGLGPDSTQRAMSKWRRTGKIQHAAITQMALARKTQTATRGSYNYNNENYGILGLVIERVTKRSYRDVCTELVLKPAGVTTAQLPTLYGAFGAMGGWWMTADDFGRFVHHALAKGPNPFDGPKTSLGGGAYYGRGTLFRDWNSGRNYWHFGALCFRKSSSQSYFASWHGGWSVVTSFNGCRDFKDMFTLDAALATAALR